MLKEEKKLRDAIQVLLGAENYAVKRRWDKAITALRRAAYEDAVRIAYIWHDEGKPIDELFAAIRERGKEGK